MKTFKTFASFAVVVATLNPGRILALPVAPVVVAQNATKSLEVRRVQEAADGFSSAATIFESLGALEDLLEALGEVQRVFGGAADFPTSQYVELRAALVQIQDGLVVRVEGSESRTPMFVRGDSNSDGVADLSDAVHMLAFQFTGGATPGCLESADVNDDGVTDVSDPVSLLGTLFGGAANPPAPYPACGAVGSQGSLSCATSTCPGVIFRQAGGGTSGGLSFTCSGSYCSCVGEADCDDMFGDEVCRGGLLDWNCFNLMGTIICVCKRARGISPGDMVKPLPPVGGVVVR